MPEEISQKLGRYVLLDKIASGGMAEVYRAKLVGIEGFEKDVAIKRILPHWSQDRSFVEMLVDEAKVLVHLTSAQIVQVYELGKDEETYFIVMEYVNGMDLRRFGQRLPAGLSRLPLPLAIYITKNILQGLAYAHGKKDRDGRDLGIVHRDISPQNILLGIDGEVKITDFGIARVFGKSTETITGTLKGKFAYMSPEQAVGHKVDWRTDLFAMGILLYEMATGERCFKGQNDFETLELVRHASVSVEPLASLPPALSVIILKALEKEKEARYQSAHEMLEALDRFELVQGERASARDLREALSPYLESESQKSAADENRLTQIRLESSVPRATRVLVSSPNLPHPDNVPTLLDFEKARTVVSRVSSQDLSNKKSLLWKAVAGVLAALIAGLGFWFWPAKPVPAPVVAVPPPVVVEAKPVPVKPVAPAPIPTSPTVKKEEPKAPAFGGISVSAQPWGLVTISGVVSGAESPVSRPKVSVGSYSVKVTYPPLQKIVSTSIRVTEGSLIKCQAIFSEPEKILCH